MTPIASRRPFRVALIVVIAALAAAGCQSQLGGSSGSAEIMLEDFRFTPNRIDAKVGVPLTVTLTNRGTERHDNATRPQHRPPTTRPHAQLQGRTSP